MAPSSLAADKRTHWHQRHLLDVTELTQSGIEVLFQQVDAYQKVLHSPVKKTDDLLGKAIANLFYENSTRTRVSFELAAKYLSADVVNFAVNESSIKKGETLFDTIETLIAMGIDAIVIRHPQSGIVHQLAQHFQKRVCFLNAGDGCHAHPSQALLDLYTLQQKWGGLAQVKNKKIVIVGDIRHSRVAHSNILLLSKLGANVHVVGPPTLLPEGIEELGCTAHTHLETGLKQADAIMCLRLQLERQQAGFVPSIAEYARLYGVSRDKIQDWASPNVLIMHQGPMNREVELMSDLADDPAYSLIQSMVTNGVLIRMALLKLSIAAKPAHAIGGG